MSSYDKYPAIRVHTGEGVHAWQGWADIAAELSSRTGGKNLTICVDCYHGVWEEETLASLVEGLKPDHVFLAADAALDKDAVNAMLAYNVTDDRVFGIMSHHRIGQFFDPAKLEKLQAEIAAAAGLKLVFGVGAALLCKADVLVYADMARWEIQQRFRAGKLANWLNDNYDEDTLRKYKRAFFVDWRVLDHHKMSLFEGIDYILDTNNAAAPRMMTGEIYRKGLDQAVTQPFRVMPYFDPGVWGGQWMKSVCGLDPQKPNYAWSFDGVPEENSLLFNVNGIVLETPAINLVLSRPRQLLGDKVHARFGAEFPIRFDFLDTMDGGNLSLQVHPLTEYIQNTFGMHYTQDESYYILDADENEDTFVYLGCKTGIDREEFAQALADSQETGTFDAEKYVNVIPAKKHDHFLIPGGTIHCSGKNCMVLEISATPYIFTFKLWDWGRLGLDGRPRPIHLEHGMVFQFEHVDVKGKYGAWRTEQIPMLFLKKVFSKWQTGLHGKAWNSLFLANHDQPRTVSHFGNDSPEHRVSSAKMLATWLHMMEGTPYIYQGEELGMTNCPFASLEEFRDIDSINGYKTWVTDGPLTHEEFWPYLLFKSRDNARTPMQWTAEENAGFTTGTPWIRVNPNYTSINAEAAIADPDSIFHYYQKLIRLRKQYPVIVYGDYTLLEEDDPNLFIYTRHLDNEELLVICNSTDQKQTWDVPERFMGAQVLITNLGRNSIPCSCLELKPYEAIVLHTVKA